MFQIGDIVRPKKCYKGHNYCFKVTEIKKEPFVKDLYRIQRIEQELDGDYSLTFQLNIIKTVEQLLWEEDELELTSNIKLRYAETDINIPDYTSIILDEMERILSKLYSKNKEGKEMKLLDLYEERKLKSIREEYSESKKSVEKDDEIQKIIIEMTNQVNTILENQGTEARYAHRPSLYTPETVEKLDELDKKRCETIEKLRSTLEEIRALFEMTDDYHERIKILKDYNILDKKGKLNI